MQPAKLGLEKQPSGRGDSLIIGLNGKLSFENAHDFLATLRQELATHLILDMSGLSFLDSAGVGALVTLFVSRRKQGKTLALAALTVQGTAVMQVAGLLKLLPVYPSVEQARAQRA
jgi:anti-anti-sigma factor